MWHCNAKFVKPGISLPGVKKARKCLQIVKQLLHKASRGVETAYMTGRMRIHANHVTAKPCAVLFWAVG
jgi:hypothetical protein